MSKIFSSFIYVYFFGGFPVILGIRVFIKVSSQEDRSLESFYSGYKKVWCLVSEPNGAR